MSVADSASNIVVARLTETSAGGDYTVADLRSTIRDQLQQERSIRRLLDQLRKEVYVSIRVDDLVRGEGPGGDAP